jgi:uncharacterized delta-60 repeat protein
MWRDEREEAMNRYVAITVLTLPVVFTAVVLAARSGGHEAVSAGPVPTVGSTASEQKPQESSAKKQAPPPTLVATASSANPVFATGGGLDATFGGDGKVTTNFTTGFDGANAMAVQADGKIVAAGEAAVSGGAFALARYNPDGRLDETFGDDGKVTTNFTRRSDRAFGVAIQADGKIVAAGEAAGGGGEFALARYNPDGTLDPTFGGDGRVTTNYTAHDDGASGVAVQRDGKIVAAGTAFSDCDCSKFALARYEADGILDASFGDAGKVTTPVGGWATAVALQPDGDIVVAGSAGDIFGPFAVVRYTSDGTLDRSFGGDGKVTTNMGCCEESANAVAIQPNGRIVVAGSVGPHEYGDRPISYFALVRYRPNGALDPTFGGDGKVKTAGFGGADAVAIQADGKIVAAGNAGSGGFALARYRADGTLDPTFGNEGEVTTNFTGGEYEALAFGVAIQADGKIVAAGHAGSGGNFALARYLGA